MNYFIFSAPEAHCGPNMHQSDGHKFIILVGPWDLHFKNPHAEKTLIRTGSEHMCSIRFLKLDIGLNIKDGACECTACATSVATDAG